MHPTGKLYPDEPSGDVAVQSDSALSSPTVSPLQPENESDLTTDHTPGPPGGPATPRVDKAPPTAFGRYQVRNALGVGGFGAVFLGYDAQLDRPVAIKVLRGGPDVPNAEAERFLQEARRLAQLSHPGIVTVHDVGLDDGQVYIVSDYLDGLDLQGWLKHNSPSWHESARIAAALADALAHAHTRLIVHRDVKPANIILTPDRGPVLVDFGLGLDETRAGGGELGVISGTPAYMSPEQVSGAAHRIDGRTDIYSLGVMLYEMLCGRVPFRADNPRELLRQVQAWTTSRNPASSSPATSRPISNGPASRRWRSGSRTALPPQRISPTSCAAFYRRRPGRRLPGHPMRLGWQSRPQRRRPHLGRAAPMRRVRPAAEPAESERRQVTVLVGGCDLFRSERRTSGGTATQRTKPQVLRALPAGLRTGGAARSRGRSCSATSRGCWFTSATRVAYEDAARRARTGRTRHLLRT